MADTIYHATGQVIDSQTSEGLADLTVEVWDAAQTTGKPLAATQTDSDGRFKVELDFAKLRLNNIPDVEFKVLRNGILLEASESGVSWNADSEEDVTIMVRVIPKNREEAKDRINTKQFLKAVEFVQQSDFMGLFLNAKDKVETRFSVLADVVANTFTKSDIEPIGTKRNYEKESLNQDVNVVKRNLEAEQIEVNVLPYNPRLNKETFSDITSFATNIKAGQQVNIYEQNGIVKYMSVVKNRKTVAINAASEEPQTDKLEKLNVELKATREDSLRKDEQISKLQQELSSIRQDHAEMKQVFKSKEFEALLKTVGKK
jgi:hypothetical protein